MDRAFQVFFPALFLLLLLAAIPTEASSVLDVFGTNAPSANPPATNTPPVNIFSQPIVLTPEQLDLQEAKRLASEGRLDEAFNKASAILQKDPKALEALILRGNINVDRQKWDLADSDYNSALQIDPDNITAKINRAEMKFRQKNYDAARSDFTALETNPDFGDLAAYKVFLCDLFGGHEDVAQKELATFNLSESNPSYYFGNVAWDLFHKNNDDARTWLNSAVHIYAPKKIILYGSSLKDLGYLPIPPP